jgi:hypothetical protein
MSEIKTIGSMDELFSTSLDDLADLAGFETPPAGSYILKVSAVTKEVNDKDAVEAAFEVVETVELTDTSGTPVPNGTKFSTLFMIDNEFGLGNLKKFCGAFADHFGTKNMGELIRDHIKDVTISGMVKTRKDKNDPEKIYGSVTNITVA